MTDQAADPDAAAARAAEQARLRKERREAKIKAGGASRLNKITGLGGVPERDANNTDATADPHEVDISLAEHYYAPRTTARIPNLAAGLGAPGAAAEQGDDAMLRMMVQMIEGGAPPLGTGGDASGTGPSPDRGPAPLTTRPDWYGAVWRVVHTVVALMLALYAASSTGLGLTWSSPSSDPEAEHEARRHFFFYSFATAETVLLTTRFFTDRYRRGSGHSPLGTLGGLAGFLPIPVREAVEAVVTYGRVFGTIRSDVLVCIFVLGCCAWWKGDEYEGARL